MANITPSQAAKLQKLISGESLPWSALPEWIMEILMDEELISIQSNGVRKSVRAQNPTIFEKTITELFTHGASLNEWIGLCRNNASRGQLVDKTGDSKSMTVRTFSGFLLDSIDPVQICNDGNSVTIKHSSGISYYIQNPKALSIPENVVVVGIENAENFCRLNEQAYLFEAMQCIFVSRYPQNASLYRWLEDIPNRYIHFGDFDLAGINIYQTEFYNRLGKRASMLVPSDIEQRIMNGNTELFDKQYAKFKSIKIIDSRVQPLYDLIMKYHRCYEQEGYIQNV